MGHRCGICKRTFSTSSGLTQHANAVHHGRTSLSRTNELIQGSQIPEHDANLWSAPITMPLKKTSSASQNIVEMEDVLFENPLVNENLNDVSEGMSCYNLQSQVQNIESEDIVEDIEIEDIVEDIETDSQSIPINFKDNDFDSEDLQGSSLNDALDTNEGKNRPERVAEWPNDAYREFMELVIKGNISNKIGDKIIKFFNKYSNLKNSPLPKSTKNGKDYLNQINSPSVDFKEKVVATYKEVDFKLYYWPIFHAIQALMQRPIVSENFVHKGVLNKKMVSQLSDIATKESIKYLTNFLNFHKVDGNITRIFGEPYESNWWLETEKTLPPLNHLLSIILYSDATTFDGLGKTSGHPVFLTLGNLPNWVRNSPEAKVLLGFLPKVQDSGIKTTDAFRSLQREVYHKCFNIMLRPLLEKPDALYFGIKGQVKIFAPRISYFLADMLEADEITATYKSSRCKMPCHTCMVLRNDLNNMNLTLENMPLRTHRNMQEIISTQGKDFSIHSVTNSFWKFP